MFGFNTKFVLILSYSRVDTILLGIDIIIEFQYLKYNTVYINIIVMYY